MELLMVLWVTGIIVYFSTTSERQRENHLLVMWGLLTLPVLYYGAKLLLGP